MMYTTRAREYNELVKKYKSIHLQFSITKKLVRKQVLATRVNALVSKIKELHAELPDRLFK